MKTVIKYLITFIAGVAAVIIIGGYIGLITANNVYIPGFSSSARDWDKPAMPVNPRQLPAVPAPDSRIDPEFEALIARKCTYASQTASGLFTDVKVRGVTRDAIDRLIVSSSANLTGNTKLLHAELINQIADVLYSDRYDLSKTQLMNYAYQYCDIRTHQVFNRGE